MNFEDKETTKRGTAFAKEVKDSIELQDSNLECIYSCREVDMESHIDMTIRHKYDKNIMPITCDVKARKGCRGLNLKRIDDNHVKYINEYTIVEYRNVRGEDGWIKAKEMDFIIHEYYNMIMVIKREELKEMTDKRLLENGYEKVERLEDAIYKLYTRNDKDIMTVVPMDDILKLKSTILIENSFVFDRKEFDYYKIVDG